MYGCCSGPRPPSRCDGRIAGSGDDHDDDEGRRDRRLGFGGGHGELSRREKPSRAGQQAKRRSSGGSGATEGQCADEQHNPYGQQDRTSDVGLVGAAWGSGVEPVDLPQFKALRTGEQEVTAAQPCLYQATAYLVILRNDGGAPDSGLPLTRSRHTQDVRRVRQWPTGAHRSAVRG